MAKRSLQFNRLEQLAFGALGRLFKQGDIATTVLRRMSSGEPYYGNERTLNKTCFIRFVLEDGSRVLVIMLSASSIPGKWMAFGAVLTIEGRKTNLTCLTGFWRVVSDDLEGLFKRRARDQKP